MNKNRVLNKTGWFVITIMFVACGGNVKHSLDLAGSNRAEIEKVLEHFKDDPNPLKYKAARFLIENMPYHYSFTGRQMEQYDSVYMVMAAEPLQSRDSVFGSLIEKIKISEKKAIRDIESMNAQQLIKIINEACDTWEHSTWRKDYSDSIFFEYVLPYRIYNEQLSDWHSIVDHEFPYLKSPTVRSRRGPVLEAENFDAEGAPIVETESASLGKMRLLKNHGSSVSFQLKTPLASRKYIILRYTSATKGGKVRILLNDRLVGDLELDPTKTTKIFRNSRKGIETDMPKGDNIITIEYLEGTVGLDYIIVASLENTENISDEDFSSYNYHISNKSTGNYITFNPNKVLARTELQSSDSKSSSSLLRLDCQGNECWSIREEKGDSAGLCLEVQYCFTDENAAVGQYTFLNGVNQKWMIMPVEDGYVRIVGKDSGLSLESTKGIDGKEYLIQSEYAGRETQKWRLEPGGERGKTISVFSPYNSIGKAAKIFDVTDRYEWIAFHSGIMPRAASLLKGSTGNCRDEAAYTVFLCRFLGIPAAVDFTPHWANRSQAHLWSVLIKPDGKSVPFYMGVAPADTVHYFHPYLKPKVLRHRFSINRDIVHDLQKEKEVPALFIEPDFIDVTDEYYTTSDVVRDIPEEVDNTYTTAYICVFDNRNWVPVYYGKISDGKVTFKSMVKNVMYMAATFSDGRIVPFGNPFLLASDGSVREIEAKISATQEIRLLRKYPFMGIQDYFNSRMSGGRFQGADNPDFVNATDLHVHEGITEGNWYDITLEKPEKYRWFRYIGPNGSYCNVNEIELYAPDGKRLVGKIIGTSGIDGKTKEKVFDNDILTGFEGESPDGHWVGMKFGRSEKIGRIRYIARNDGNCIEIGDYYELLYWHNNEWESLGKKRATENVLIYTDIPSGGLYVVRNLTKGSEERIFTYENGKQIWW